MTICDAGALIREISNHKPIILWLIELSHTYFKQLLIFLVRGWLIEEEFSSFQALIEWTLVVKRTKVWSIFWESSKHRGFSKSNSMWKENISTRNILRGTDRVKQIAPKAIMSIWMEAMRRHHHFQVTVKEMVQEKGWASLVSLWRSLSSWRAEA